MMGGVLWPPPIQETCHSELDETVSIPARKCSVARYCPASLKGALNQAVSRAPSPSAQANPSADACAVPPPDDRFSGRVLISEVGHATVRERACTPTRTPRTLRALCPGCAVDRARLHR